MKRIIWLSIFIVLFFPACKVREFALPVWDVDVSIPLINEKYYAADLVDTVHIITDQNELLHLVSNGHLQTDEIFSISTNPEINHTVPVASGVTVSTEVPLYDASSGYSLSYGLIKSGNIRYEFRNINPAVSLIRLSLPDLKHPDGTPLQIVYEDAAMHTVDLHGMSIGQYNSQIMLQNLQVSLYSESSLPQGTILGEIYLQMLDELHFSLFQGELDNYEIEAQTGTSGINVEYPFGLENAISLQEATIQIDITNQVNFSCKFSGSLRASRGNREVIIPILDDTGNPFIIPAATQNALGQRTLVLHDNISQLLQIMPTQIDVINPKFTIDTSSGFGSLQDSQIITAEYLVDAPFRFTLRDNPFEIQTVTELSISENNRDTIRKNLMDAQLNILLQNTLPLGGSAYAYFSRRQDIDINSPASYDFVKTIDIQSCNDFAGWQQIPGLSLSRDELLLFAEQNVYLKWVFCFDNTNGPVEIYASTADYIALKGSFMGKIRVED